MLRTAWILGFVSTQEYSQQIRSDQVGYEFRHSRGRLQTILLEERVAIVVFLLGVVLLAYTFLNAPGFA